MLNWTVLPFNDFLLNRDPASDAFCAGFLITFLYFNEFSKRTTCFLLKLHNQGSKRKTFNMLYRCVDENTRYRNGDDNWRQ